MEKKHDYFYTYLFNYFVLLCEKNIKIFWKCYIYHKQKIGTIYNYLTGIYNFKSRKKKILVQ